MKTCSTRYFEGNSQNKPIYLELWEHYSLGFSGCHRSHSQHNLCPQVCSDLSRWCPTLLFHPQPVNKNIKDNNIKKAKLNKLNSRGTKWLKISHVTLWKWVIIHLVSKFFLSDFFSHLPHLYDVRLLILSHLSNFNIDDVIEAFLEHTYILELDFKEALPNCARIHHLKIKFKV